MAKQLLAVIVLCGAVSAAFVNQTAEFCRFLPENDSYIPVEQTSSFAGLTEADFNAVLDRVQSIFGPEIATNGGELVINRLWDNGTVNASAQRMGNKFVINMYGGLARHEAITQDGFALVACHELGHHIGGAPKVKNFMMSWASNEGQSDYYATLKCLRRFFADDDNVKIVSQMEVQPLAKQTCEQLFTSRDEQALCIRGSMAGWSVSSLFLAFKKGGKIDLATPDPKEVRKTFNSHPQPQCRLDTYFAGAICTVGLDQAVDQKNFKSGTCWDAKVTAKGIRPRCWHQPKPTWWERWKNRDQDVESSPDDGIVGGGEISPEIF